MIGLLHLQLAAALAGAAAPDRIPCTPLDEDAIRSGVAAVRAASAQHDITGAQAELGVQWRRTCVPAREHASPAVVSGLAGLLRIEPRWTVATMLLDVRDNLRYARPAIAQALRDVRAQERRWRRENTLGVVFYDPEAIPDSLRCLLFKIRTGREDHHLCRFLLGLREADSFR